MAERKARKETAKKVGATKTKTAPKKAAAKTQPKIKTKSPTKGKTTPTKSLAKKALPKKNTDTTRKISAKSPASKKLSEKISEEERRIALRRSLVAQREQIVREAKSEISKYIKGETRQLVDTALDDGDWSVVDLSEDISLRQLSAHRDTLQKTDEALRKLDEGTYGICEDCGETISEKRLKILPFAIYCTDCQERREEIEEMERRER
jgi:DnaK suppressor protein